MLKTGRVVFSSPSIIPSLSLEALIGELCLDQEKLTDHVLNFMEIITNFYLEINYE